MFNRDIVNIDNTAGYWTHITPLTTVILNTTGTILEMGCGDYSTPLLHALCKNSKRSITTADCELEWMCLFKDLETDWHKFIHINNWDDVNGSFGVIFIDHNPIIANDTPRRVDDLMRLKKSGDVFVIHDTEKIRWYRYQGIFEQFKYVYHYSRYKKRTTILSDKIDVSKFFE